MVRYRSTRRTCSESQDDSARTGSSVTGQEVDRIKLRLKDPHRTDDFGFAARDEHLIPQTSHFAGTQRPGGHELGWG